MESGLGASGIPHIGSLGDAARPFGILLALENLGYKSELIAYSDDMDALRKVPAGLPRWLSDWIGHPVSKIPDPFNCHKSYGEHMGAMLREGLDQVGIRYTFKSGYEVYTSGFLNKQISTILQNADKIGEQIAAMLGQTKYQEVLPYFPICENCDRLNVARAISFDQRNLTVHYACEGDQIGRKFVKGCGHEGIADITKGQGKLSWKVEFAARWQALDIRFESYGKDLIDSVKINDWVSENILGYPPPYHIRFEHFLEKTGKKMSKSVGNVFTPQAWLRYGSPQSLLLLMFKRITGTRSIGPDVVPQYMDEYDWLEDVYFGKLRPKNKMEGVKLRGLYEYVNRSNPPPSPSTHVPYQLLAQLCSVAPEDGLNDFAIRRLISYGLIKSPNDEVLKRISFASKFVKEVQALEKKRSVKRMSRLEKHALEELVKELPAQEDPNSIQTKIFETAKRNNIPPPDFFKLLYRIILGSDRGPRLGPYIADIGPAKVTQMIQSQLHE